MPVQDLALFIISSAMFIITPGLDTIFVVNKALTESKKSGYVSALGIAFGVLFHSVLASFGLSIILAKSIFAFTLIKYLGAAYLVFLGIKALLTKNQTLQLSNEIHAQTNLRKVFLGATLTNIMNPKVILFFLAFFPQFVKTSLPYASQAFLALGSLYAVMSLIWLVVLSAFISVFAGKLRAHPKAQIIIQKITGSAFILFGLKIALTKNI